MESTMTSRRSTRTMHLRRVLLALLLITATSGAFAVTATITGSVHLRAGPSVEYPSVVMMPAGSAVEVFGCEQGYSWCDVQLGPDRGWVAAAFLAAPSPGGPVVIAGGPAPVGIPIVTFSFNTYWGDYYRGRPWYGRRDYYYNYWNRYPHGRPPPLHRPPPRPPLVRPPPAVRPPPPPPGNGRPPVGRPSPGRPPGNGKPPGRPPGNGQPPPRDGDVPR
jgi:uncharacterized protein YraI